MVAGASAMKGENVSEVFGHLDASLGEYNESKETRYGEEPNEITRVNVRI